MVLVDNQQVPFLLSKWNKLMYHLETLIER